MKSLMWNAIAPKSITGTIWEKLNDSKVIIDKNEFENKFYDPRKKKDENLKAENIFKNAVGQIIAPKIETQKKISILPADRSRNISLVLKKLRLRNEDIVKSIYELNEEILDINIIESLISINPTEAEISAVQSQIENKKNFDIPELFILEISKINGLKYRLLAFK